MQDLCSTAPTQEICAVNRSCSIYVRLLRGTASQTVQVRHISDPEKSTVDDAVGMTCAWSVDGKSEVLTVVIYDHDYYYYYMQYMATYYDTILPLMGGYCMTELFY